MRLTPDILRSTYDFLRMTPPFHRLRLPAGSEVKFTTRGLQGVVPTAGHHCAPIRAGIDPHLIGVTGRYVSHTDNLVRIMAHEMVHAAVAIHHPSDRSEHGSNFKRIAAQVCKHHGFDPFYF